MNAKKQFDLKSIFGKFSVLGTFVSAAPYGSGHINDTFALVCDQGGTSIRYILQRINHNIFTNPEALMDNIHRVTSHQQLKLRESGIAEASRRALTLVPSYSGIPYHRDKDGNYWRLYIFVEHATGHDLIETPTQAEAAARAFGAFQQLLVDLPGAPLAETIPNFHNTPARFEALIRAIDDDKHNRAAQVQDVIKFATSRKRDTEILLELHKKGEIPSLVTHNDTKLNNVLLDNVTGEGICVIDLDTVMPGLALYDFGDMVRTATNAAKEDEQDLSLTYMRMPIFEALAKGYLASAKSFLGKAELQLLPFAGKLLTFECGIRFLTDYLNGDVYFKTHRPGQNMDRCRGQFKLVESIEQNTDAMQAVVDQCVCN